MSKVKTVKKKRIDLFKPVEVSGYGVGYKETDDKVTDVYLATFRQRLFEFLGFEFLLKGRRRYYKVESKDELIDIRDTINDLLERM